MRLAVLWLCAAAMLPALAEAATHRLDDSASQVSPPVAEWRWQPHGTRGSSAMVELDLQVRVRIDMRAWEGREGRVFMVMSPDAGHGLVATWEGQGRMRPGRLYMGERALVYEGRITGPWLEDVLRVHLTNDTRLAGPVSRRIEFRFELDTP